MALYLLASRSALATAIELGKRAPPHLDYTLPPEDSYTPEELMLELAVGLTPVLGEVSELVWGQPYHFIEAKGRQELANTGNLKAMLDYVGEYGGHVELWVRSTTHPAGQTQLTKPLQRYLNELIRDGKATIKYYP